MLSLPFPPLHPPPPFSCAAISLCTFPLRMAGPALLLNGVSEIPALAQTLDRRSYAGQQTAGSVNERRVSDSDG